jgi:hypothetical protein
MACLSCSNHSSRKKSIVPAVRSQPTPVAKLAAERASLAAAAAALLLTAALLLVLVLVLLAAIALALLPLLV